MLCIQYPILANPYECKNISKQDVACVQLSLIHINYYHYHTSYNILQQLSRARGVTGRA